MTKIITDEKTVEQAKATSEVSTPTISFRSGNTTFVVGLHFSQSNKDTLEDKVRHMIREDVKAGNF